ncbi:MAG: MFS transporter [Xanthobacteraceae bacterium]
MSDGAPGNAAAAPAASASTAVISPWAPFRQSAFTMIWTATLVANIGGWMYSAASGWLMTDLDPNPLIVSLVQAATTAPMFIFALPAGAFADIFDKRRYLIVFETVATIVSAVYAVLVSLHLATPFNLLLFTFLISVAGALTSPAWQAVVTQLVPREDLPAAIAANSVGINISRALGPALGGLIIVALGIAAPFWLNAICNVAVIVALVWWRTSKRPNTLLPVEGFNSAVWTGLRYSRHNPHLNATLLRASGFFLFSSAFWALLPLVARSQIAGGPELYGILLGVIGMGAVAGAFGLPALKAKWGPDVVMALATAGTALAMVLFGLAREPITALIASAIAGASWIAALATLNISAQVALPDWVRGRGLAVFTTAFFGCVTIGSAVWGEVAFHTGLPLAHLAAAAGLLATIPLTWRWKLQTGMCIDLSPSMHWPAPITAREIEHERGPVLVSVEYRVRPQDRAEFLKAIAEVEHERRRDGAYAWGVFEDTAEEGRIIETFLVESWMEHLRQHERVTNADRLVEEAALRFNLNGAPKVTHFIAAEF